MADSVDRRRRVRRRFGVAACVYVVAIAAACVIWQSAHGRRWAAVDAQLAVVLATYFAVGLVLLRVLVDWRRLWRKALLGGVVSAGLFVLLVEAVGRLTQPAAEIPNTARVSVADNRLHHRIVPETVSQFEAYGQRIEVRMNEDGLRTRHSRAAFGEHEPRIAVLGDSLVYGFLLPAEQAIPAQLEGMLRRSAAGRDAAVLNCGMIGYSPLLQRQQYEDIVQHYRPQLTILCLYSNDVADDYYYAQRNRGTPDELRFSFPEAWTRPKGEPPLEATMALLRGAGLLRPIHALFGEWAPRGTGVFVDAYAPFEVTVAGRIERDIFFVHRHPLSATRRFFDATWKNVLAIREQASAIGSRFVVVLLPTSVHWNAAEAYPLCFRDDAHYNAAGSRYAARGVFEGLVELEVLLDVRK